MSREKEKEAQQMGSRRFMVYVLFSALIVALAGTAQATVFDVSVKNRNFCCTNPPVFAFGAPQAMAGYHTVPPNAFTPTMMTMLQTSKAVTASVTGTAT